MATLAWYPERSGSQMKLWVSDGSVGLNLPEGPLLILYLSVGHPQGTHTSRENTTLERNDSNGAYLRHYSFIHSLTHSFMHSANPCSGKSYYVSGITVALGMQW